MTENDRGLTEGQRYCFPSLGEPCGKCHRCAETKADYLLDGSPESVAVVREARGLPVTTLTVTASPREVLTALDLARFAFTSSPVSDEVSRTLDALIRAAMAARDTCPLPPDLTDDGMGNTCSHTSATGVDTTSWTDPNKVWRCDHCGLRWVQGPDGTRVTPPAMPLSASDSTPGAERPP